MARRFEVKNPSWWVSITSAVWALALIATWPMIGLASSPAYAVGSPSVTIPAPAGPIIVNQATSFPISIANFSSTNLQATVELVDQNGTPDSNGTLAIDQTGLTLANVQGYSRPSGINVGFSGSLADVTSALATVSWTPATEEANFLKVSITTKPDANVFYSSNTGHYYQYVSTATTWTNARTTAQGMTLYGMKGYLAHITTLAENEFIKDGTTATNIWIGTTDAGANEGQWRWAGLEGTGDTIASDIPTISGVASTYYLNDVSPAVVADGYNWGYSSAVAGGWASGEPNDAGSNEDCAVTNWGSRNGRWNDLPCTYSTGYLVEFGGREASSVSTAESVQAQQKFDVLSTRASAPTVTAIEADDSELKVSFTAPAYSGTSSITNYKYSTDGTTYRAFSPDQTSGPFLITTLSSDGTTPLSNGTAYPITLKAVNSAGDSAASNSLTGTPAAPPPPSPTQTPSPPVIPAPTPSVSAPTPPSPEPTPQITPGPITPPPAPPAPASTPEPVPAPTPTPEPAPPQPTGVAALLSNPAAVIELVSQVGEPVPNSAIGASGDDSIIVAFDPVGSPEAVKATNNLVGATAAVAGVAAAAGAAGAAAAAAGAAAGAAGAAGSAGAAASSASAAGSAGGAASGGGTGAGGGGGSTAQAGADMTEDVLDAMAGAEYEVSRIRQTGKKWGDRWALWRWKIGNFWDGPSTQLTLAVAPATPLLAKLLNDASYLRAIAGPLSLALPIVGVALAVESLQVNQGTLLHPPVALYLWLVILGIFDAFAGSLAMTVFVLGSLPLMDFSAITDWRMLAGIVVSGFGPIVIARSIRDFRRPAPRSGREWLTRVGDIAFASLMGGWVAGLIIRSLPALTGLTLPAANYVLTFQIYATLAIALRVVVEDFAARFFPQRLDQLTPDTFPSPPSAQIVSAQILRFVFYIFVASAFMGFGPVVWFAALLFMVPTVMGYFSDKLPNSRILWRLLPTGLAGLAMMLGLEIVLENTLSAIWGDHPSFSTIFVLALLSLIIVVALLSMMAREGAPREQHWLETSRFSALKTVGALMVFLLLIQFTSML